MLQPVKRPDPTDEQKERDIMRQLEESPEIEKFDLKTNPTVAPNAVTAFYDHYKKHSKIRQ